MADQYIGRPKILNTTIIKKLFETNLSKHAVKH